MSQDEIDDVVSVVGRRKKDFLYELAALFLKHRVELVEEGSCESGFLLRENNPYASSGFCFTVEIPQLESVLRQANWENIHLLKEKL
jgi:hypothetical protein